MSSQLIMAVNASAEKKVTPLLWVSKISIVGLVTTETVTVQIQRVAEPVEANDAHWTDLYQNDELVQLRAGHNAEDVSGLDLVRLVKTAGVSSNAFGVKRSS